MLADSVKQDRTAVGDSAIYQSIYLNLLLTSTRGTNPLYPNKKLMFKTHADTHVKPSLYTQNRHYVSYSL